MLRRRARAAAIVVAAARDRCCGVQECWQAGGERECCGVERERWRAVVLRRRAGAVASGSAAASSRSAGACDRDGLREGKRSRSPGGTALFSSHSTLVGSFQSNRSPSATSPHYPTADRAVPDRAAPRPHYCASPRPLITLSREVAEEASGGWGAVPGDSTAAGDDFRRPPENGGAKLRSRGSSSSRAPLVLLSWNPRPRSPPFAPFLNP